MKSFELGMAPELSARMETKQEQRLSPRHFQALDLLALPMSALEASLRKEILENPFLEMGIPEGADGDWDGPGASGGSDLGGDLPVVAQTKTLADHLLDQLRLLRLSPQESAIAEEIVGNLDSRGFLTCPLDEIHRAVEESGPRESVESVLARIQELDPPGVGARDLRESLAIQLRAQGKTDAIAYRIVSAHFDALAEKRWDEIAALLRIERSVVKKVASEISELDPAPGLNWEDGTAPDYVIPDLIVEDVGGEFQVRHNDDWFPRLQLAHSYRDIVSQGNFADRETKEFITQRLERARWYMQAIEQRRRTVLDVAEYLVEHQSSFLKEGDEHLVPLTLRDVAGYVRTHESTVSRATQDKYIQTPCGVFPLRKFFARGIPTDYGPAVTSAHVKAQIGRMVGDEEPTAPISDLGLTDALRRDGIQISRRTVAKYRVELGIPSASQRRVS